MGHVRWLPDALEDMKRLHAFIEPHSPSAAARAVDKLIQSAESPAEFPEQGRPWESEPEFRELIIKFGARAYVIRYRLTDDEVFIVRVWHTLEDR